MTASDPLIRIGWRERVDLPAWGLTGVRAKIDTGARTSVIDVAEIEYLDEGHVRFEVVWRQTPERQTKWIEAEAVRTSRVKPSTGELQERVVCKTLLRVGEIEREIEVGLVCRKNMRCRMLIGRKALDGLFLVDPSQVYLVTSPRRRKGRP
ncbi:MAG: ATP-dependent zinc protease [Phycisphaerales bacterium]|nr:ATP-dependent zinc protease [Phycisphaerales bacterium]